MQKEKNNNPNKYPGIIYNKKASATTTIASDDWQETSNHHNGTWVWFLFMDGHTKYMNNPNAKENDYKTYPLADPLTD